MFQLRFVVFELLTSKHTSQVFPDEFHLDTLESFLEACKKLHEAVNVQRIVCTLMDRLAKYRARQVGPPSQYPHRNINLAVPDVILAYFRQHETFSPCIVIIVYDHLLLRLRNSSNLVCLAI